MRRRDVMKIVGIAVLSCLLVFTVFMARNREVPYREKGESDREHRMTLLQNEKIPENSIIPENPITSEKPVVPEESKAPENSIAPEEHIVPEDPIAPEKPIVPEKNKAPEEPKVPAESIAPEEPKVPAESIAPEKNIVPEESKVPENSTAPENDPERVYEQEVVRLVNEERAKYGLPALSYSEELSQGAREKSRDMQKNGYFSHTSPTYGSPFDQMKSMGIRYNSAGENIAMGYPTPEAVVDGWMHSEGHRANILSEKYSRIGVGYVKEGHYATQWFAG